MQARLNWYQIVPEAYKAMATFSRFTTENGLDSKLNELVKLRASQINQCAYCIDMHWKDARAIGESEQRLYGLNAWRESPYYTDKERAALEWTEAITLLTDGFVPDDVFDRVRSHFSDGELVKLTIAVITINSWNRLSVAFRAVAGSYQSPKTPAGS